MNVVFDSKKDKITPKNFKHLLNDLYKLDKPVKGGNKKSIKNETINNQIKKTSTKNIELTNKLQFEININL